MNYTTLLQHIGCTAYTHEAAGLLGGDEIVVKRAPVQTDFGNLGDVLGVHGRTWHPPPAN